MARGAALSKGSAAISSSEAASPAVSILATPLAQSYTHVHALLLLTLYTLAFPALVADPVATMRALLPATGLLQLAYCVICLPAAASGSAARAPTPARLVPALLSLLLAVLASPLLALLAVLLGAPLTTHLPHTALLGLHVALLGLLPLVYVHGLDPQRWMRLLSLEAPLDDCLGGWLGVLLGGWLGAVPVPLDWDREWQRWPVTILTGVVMGYVMGKMVGGGVAWGRRIDFI